MDNIGLIATGCYLPEHTLTNDQLSEMVDTSDEWIFSRTGMRVRHIAKDETVLSMAEKAALDALKSADMQPGELDLIIVTSVTQDKRVPSLACEIMRQLDIECAAFDINAACSGFMYAVHIAKGLMQSGLHKNVLVVASEKLSAITDYTDRRTCVLFGDGAGAAVLSTEKGATVLYTDIKAQPDAKSMLYCNLPTAEDGDCYLHMDGNGVFRFATEAALKHIRETLSALDMTVGDIDLWIPHQANMRIIKAIAKRLGMDMDRTVCMVDKLGNTSASSVPIALDSAIKTGRVKPGDRVLLNAFGGGLTLGTVVLQF